MNASFGSTAPYAEPLWYSRDISPYYKSSHRALRGYVRTYVETHLAPYAAEIERAGDIPASVRASYVAHGFAIVHPPKEEYMGSMTLPAGIPPAEWDTFHSIVVSDELTRVGYSGVTWGLNGGNGIGCPPIANFGSEAQKAYFLPRVAKGEIRFCLGITEPDAGSDVAGLRTTAERKGDVFVVNGAKKWITNGIWADYCTTAVRTGGPGRGGLSLLIIPLESKGVSRRRMENSGVHASGSTYITFEDVEVPVENLIGKENRGFAYIMANFNPERLGLASAALRLSRVCVEDAWNYALSRETFGSPLIAKPIILAKFSKFGRLIEPVQAFMEQLAYHVEVSKATGKSVNIGGMTALLKVMSTRCLEKVCREAQQVMGGAGYARSGKGSRIEQISRDVRVYVVGEEVKRYCRIWLLGRR
ncbi:hypothetical protein H2203_001779 [Taxawa tesnikishii (nom. ined.)]|nr:hypothetical protein H2203_001779 [Dothideales sp. JES 119]